LGAEPNDYQWTLPFAVRSHRFRFVDNRELYDMVADPGQTTNVIDQHPGVAEAMRSAYDAWWRETRPMMVHETGELADARPFHVDYYQQRDTTGIPEWAAPASTAGE
ncbi:MAG: arylsulfatase, partial [Planctomycetota bacterium]